MIVADVLGPWHCVEVTDDETGETRIEERRLPQFLHDIGSLPWRDVTAQAADVIPPTPGLGVWRVWCDDVQLATLVETPGYEVLQSAEVAAPHADPATWPVLVAPRDRAESTDAFPPLPPAGTWLEAGKPYQYGDGVVVVRQDHTRTEHEPSTVPALFLVWRADAGDVLPWIAGEQVWVGTQRTYGGATYTALQSHVTESTWQPPNVPALWAVVVEEPTTDEWAVGVAYSVGDEVTYGGVLYRCRQAHTSIATWTPPAVLALWLPL